MEEGGDGDGDGGTPPPPPAQPPHPEAPGQHFRLAVVAVAVSAPLALYFVLLVVDLGGPWGVHEACEGALSDDGWQGFVGDGDALKASITIWLATVACILAAVVCHVLLLRRWSRHLCWAGYYCGLLYAQALSNATSAVFMCHLGEDAVRAFAQMICGWLTTAFFLFGLIALQKLLYQRVHALQQTMQQDLGAQRLRRTLRLQVVAGSIATLVTLLVSVLPEPADGDGEGDADDVSCQMERLGIGLYLLRLAGYIVGLLAYGVTVWGQAVAILAFSAPLRRLLREDFGSKCPIVRKAKLVATLQCAGVMASFITSALTVSLYFMQIYFGNVAWFSLDIMTAVDMAANVMGAVLCSGVLHAEPAAHDPALFEKQRVARHVHFLERWKVHPEGEWQQTVEELAQRGFTVGALLQFYEHLRETMPHFDPAVHTTSDVVHSSVIPLTRGTGSPFASKMMGGESALPRTMVTHVWSGLFIDLVAAVCSHALNESCYGIVADILLHDLSAVRTLLDQARKLDETYWVCAFCVNQHRAICNESAGGLYRPCGCKEVKYLNNTPPVSRSDGKSIPCELNKFGDMMAFLASQQPRFQHLIIVDPSHSVFTRAWCMKETHEGYCTGMVQSMMFKNLSDSTLSSQSLVHVEHMGASRLDDIKEILDSIGDKNAFNQALQQLIFDSCGLLGSWLAGDTAKQMTVIGWMARWLPFAAQMPTPVQSQILDHLGWYCGRN